MRGILFAAGMLLASGALAEDDSPLTSLVTGNDAAGWEAVGRLNLGTRAFCTASLIAPDLLLTAAHCIYDDRSGELIDPSEMEFLAGWRNNRATAYRGVARAVAHPGYEPGAEKTAFQISNDVALLKLDAPILNASIQPFSTGARPRKGMAVDVVSYAQNRSNRPARQKDCHVLARPADGLILSCLVDFGSSGAPVFVLEDGEPQIVSVVSAMSEVRGRNVSIGTALTEPLEELKVLLAKGEAPEEQGGGNRLPVVRRLTEETPRDENGAKFVRP